MVKAASAVRTLLMNHRRQFNLWIVSLARHDSWRSFGEKDGKKGRNYTVEREGFQDWRLFVLVCDYLANFWPASGLGNKTPNRVGFDNKQELERAVKLSGYLAQLDSIPLIY